MSTHTHTHTHTEREREREREINTMDESLLNEIDNDSRGKYMIWDSCRLWEVYVVRMCYIHVQEFSTVH